MIPWGIDSESYPIRPGRQAPLVVCGQTPDGRLEIRADYLDRLEVKLRDPAVLIFGHEIAYEAVTSIASRPALLPLWLDAYEANRVTCTLEREALILIAKGKIDGKRLDLVSCLDRYRIPHVFREGEKEGRSKENARGGVRVRYHELEGRPVADYPEDAARYALGDLVVNQLFAEQERLTPSVVLEDQYRQARASLWLRMTSAHGMRVDPIAVAEFTKRTEAEHTIVKRLLMIGQGQEDYCATWNAQHPDARRPLAPVPFAGGLVRLLGSKDTKQAAERMRAVCAAQRLPVPITKTGKKKIEDGTLSKEQAGVEYTALDADSCLATGDPILIAYARYTSIGTLRSRAERLRLAGEYGIPIQPRFTTLKKTGRTSCSAGDVQPGREVLAFGDQTQNLMRAPGLRECYVAREGCVIISSDWKAAELGTLAQTCLDLGLDSELARVLNSGRDVHVWYACKVKGWAYEWAEAALRGDHGPDAKKAVKKARQDAKPCNFGFPGGLGIEKFRLFAAKQYQAFFTEDEAKAYREIWLDALPEMRLYFRHITQLIDSGAPLRHFKSNRYRGDLRYTSAANSYFQGRCGDMLKDAGWRITAWIHRNGIPARIWNEAHDEIMVETPEAIGDFVAREVVRIMEEVAREWCPGAPPSAEPAIQRSWRKGAEPAYDARGRLIPHEDRRIDSETQKKITEALARGESSLYVSWVHGISATRVEQIARGRNAC